MSLVSRIAPGTCAHYDVCQLQPLLGVLPGWTLRLCDEYRDCTFHGWGFERLFGGHAARGHL